MAIPESTSVADRRARLLPLTTLAAAVTNVLTRPIAIPKNTKSITVQSKFARAAGGTDLTVHVQTTFDGGETWADIIAHHFLITTLNQISAVRRDVALAASITPTDATLADDSIIDGLIGALIRLKYTSTGTYTGASSIQVDAHFAS